MMIKQLVVYRTPIGANGHTRETSDHKMNLHDGSNLSGNLRWIHPTYFKLLRDINRQACDGMNQNSYSYMSQERNCI